MRALCKLIRLFFFFSLAGQTAYALPPALPARAAANGCPPALGALNPEQLRALPSKHLSTDLNLDLDDSNRLFRQGLVTSHIATARGRKNSMVMAFPAGNSGVSIWFRENTPGEKLSLGKGTEAIEWDNGLRGVRVTVTTPAKRLTVESFVLGSIRHIRNYEDENAKPPEIAETIDLVNARTLQVSRKSSNDECKCEYRLLLRARNGTQFRRNAEGKIEIFQTAADKNIQLEVSGLTNELPLTPISPHELLREEFLKNADPISVKMLSFLSYKEKMLAGSWRYFTYFGRDTLLTTKLLLPALRPEVVESVLGAVIERLNQSGEVAHEEDIGDSAGMARKTRGESGREPLYDYKMIDGNFMLAIDFVDYLRSVSSARAREFLDRKTSSGLTYRQALQANLRFVLAQARPYAETRNPKDLISLKPGEVTGQWRDSRLGEGYGRYPYDVNAALVPAALEAGIALFSSKELGMADPAAERKSRDYLKAWKEAYKAFEVEIPAKEAGQMAQAYLTKLRLKTTLPPLPENRKLVFSALALDENGEKIRVMNSDNSFMLLFQKPPPELLDQIADQLTSPFPLGLVSDVGMFIANPAFAGSQKTSDGKQVIESLFTRNNYHGTVVWGMQNSMMIVGLREQLERTDLPPPTRNKLELAQARLQASINRVGGFKNAELLTFEVKNGSMVPVPYGQGAAHDTASNPVQLWSLVLGILKPVLPWLK